MNGWKFGVTVSAHNALWHRDEGSLRFGLDSSFVPKFSQLLIREAWNQSIHEVLPSTLFAVPRIRGS
jgi:hypothetical protein